MIIRLLNLGFAKKANNVYMCEDIVVEVRGDKLYIPHLQAEMTIDELEHYMLAD